MPQTLGTPNKQQLKMITRKWRQIVATTAGARMWREKDKMN